MSKKDSEYYYIDIDITNMKIINWGVSATANLTGDTEIANVHRVFLTRGQFNKFEKKSPNHAKS